MILNRCNCENGSCEAGHSNVLEWHPCQGIGTVRCHYIGAMCGPCSAYMPDRYLEYGPPAPRCRKGYGVELEVTPGHWHEPRCTLVRGHRGDSHVDLAQDCDQYGTFRHGTADSFEWVTA